MPSTSRARSSNLSRHSSLRKGRIKQSKQVNDRIAMEGALCGTIESCKEEATVGLGGHFADDLRQGEILPDYELSLVLVARKLEAVRLRMEAADEEYCGVSTQRKELWEACEKVARKELNPKMVKLRRLIDLAFGKKEGRRIHRLEGKTLRKPRRVLGQARDMVNGLKACQRRSPKPRSPGFPVDCEAWLREVQPAYEKLAGMLQRQLPRQEAAETAACVLRDTAMEAFDVEYAKALRYVDGVFRLAGFASNRCDRLRPYGQRRKMSRWARAKREARARAKRLSQQAAHSVAKVSGWLGWRRAA